MNQNQQIFFDDPEAIMEKDDDDIILPTELENEFADLVGDVSQTIYACSYNSDDVLNGVLRKSLRDYSEISSDKASLREMLPNLENIQDRLVELIGLTGGWPLCPGMPITPLDKLPQDYIDIFISAGRTDLLNIKKEN